MTTTVQHIRYDALSDFTDQVFRAAGCPDNLRPTVVKNLLMADLRGVDSHGVARLSGYLRLVDAGRIDLTKAGFVVHETPSTALYDGEKGMGHAVATRAMELAIQKATVSGSGWVSVRNSNHFGLAGTYALMAAEARMIGIAMTNASPLVAPTYGLDRLLGTNPIAVAVPAGKYQPFVLDMATTTAANGKLEVLQRKNLPAPDGWIQDANGHTTTDANGVKLGGALRPLGGTPEGASHKGYGLGAVVDVLSGVLSGAGFSKWVPPFVAFLPLPEDPVGEGIGHFFGAIRVDGFMPADQFNNRMEVWLNSFKQSHAQDGHQVIIPGEPEAAITAQRLAEGIPLLPAVLADLDQIAARFGVQPLVR